jgi:hypothetical protein
MEPEHQHFAVQRVQPHQRGSNPLAVFKIRHPVEGRRLVVRDLEGHGPVVFAAALEQLIQAAHGPLAPQVDNQIARDGKQPGLKTRLAVELPAPHQNPHPDLLEQVLGHLAVPGQIQQIPHQPVLVADNQLIQQPGILALQAIGNGQALLPRQFLFGSGNGRGKHRLGGGEGHHSN